MKDQETRKLELIIGAFILGGLALIMGMIVITSDGLSFFSNDYAVVVELTHIGDLKPGAPIKQGGYKIGKVRKIGMTGRLIEIECRIDRRRQLSQDCTAHIANAGLVGDTFLEFAQGVSDKYLPMSDKAKDAPHVRGESPMGMTEMMGQMQKIGNEVTLLVKNLNDIVGDDQVKSDIKQTVNNVNGTTAEAEKLVARLRLSAEKIEEAASDVSKTTEAARKMIVTVSELGLSDLLADNKMADRIVTQWVAENRRLSAEEMALEWKRFSSQQKAMYGIILDPGHADGVPPWKKEGYEQWKSEHLKKHSEFRSGK